MADVFISYSRNDQVTARRLLDALHEHVYDVWVVWADIPLAATWWTEIVDGIENCSCFVCLLSPDYAGSQVCQIELAQAIRLKKRIVPVVLRSIDQAGFGDVIQADLPAYLADAVGERDSLQQAHKNWSVVSRLNWLFYPQDEVQFGDFVRQLADAVTTDLEYTRKHTHYGMSAKKWDERGRKTEFLLRGEELQEAIIWLQMSLDKSPSATDLHRQYIIESQHEAERHSDPLRKAVYATTYRLFRLGPHKIFISYRRADSAYACGWMYDQLERAFGRKNIFLDVDSIDYGTDFSQFIQRTLTECFAVLVVIGPSWASILNARSEKGEPDFVRVEVELALKRKHVNVIPLLIGDTVMPGIDELPATMRDLRLQNGTPIRSGRTFHQDMAVLIKELRKLRSQVRTDLYT